MKVNGKKFVNRTAGAPARLALLAAGMLISAAAGAQVEAEPAADDNLPAIEPVTEPPATEPGTSATEAGGRATASQAEPVVLETSGMQGDPDPVAAQPDSAGEDPAPATSDEDLPGQQPAQAAAEYAPLSDPVRDYLDAIERTEALSSAYSSELSDLYLGLGQHHLERQEFDEARKAFLRGLQITRVNNGLYAIEQTHFMFSLADIESRLGEMAAAEEILRNIYNINAKSLGYNHPDMLPVLSQMLNWYTTRNVLYGPGSRYSNMVKAERITHEMAMIIEGINGLAHPETARIYRRLGQLNFHLADQLSRFGYTDDATVSFSSGYGARSNGIPPSVKTHFSQGRDAFAKFSEAVYQDASRTPLDRADAIAQLADWYLVFDKAQSAADHYERAYSVLQEGTPDSLLIEEYFGAPKPLDFMDIPQYNPQVQQELAGETLEVSITVTKGGQVRNLEILQIPGDLDKDQIRMVRRELNAVRFRPRVVAGLPEQTEQFVWQYPTQPAGAAAP